MSKFSAAISDDGIDIATAMDAAPEGETVIEQGSSIPHLQGSLTDHELARLSQSPYSGESNGTVDRPLSVSVLCLWSSDEIFTEVGNYRDPSAS